MFFIVKQQQTPIKKKASKLKVDLVSNEQFTIILI
jgi:hypothetical protein